ncbi:ArsR/SmtB family transcription factor [Acholeplasma hippikon]|uniref:Transcriptional repressor smtB homolog n=1 Tax=Acholeplasma hippikon TaxID=264636 RepID=A0A449BIA2_9MOLU|nr:metalloregulator ArsR/SmtB family transcription factor [Acholeplasma hippikon]VEU82143.1 Transcriptional repressor smtB homolog [Acholeplasma hippikon]
MDKVTIAKQNLLDEVTKGQVSDLFKSLSDPTRIAIIFALKGTELTVTELTVILEMTQSAISHQLRILRDNNIVSNKKIGKEVYYRLSDDHIYSIFNQAIEHVKE